jgi:IMP dehydrogenase/GMP reductase
VAPSNSITTAKPAAKTAAAKTGVNPNFGTNMPMMSSAFDTAMWLNAA